MADASYDAIIVGGGTKALIVGMYLAKYGGMEVAIFEKRHEVGGGWCTDEGPAPGFLADYHATALGRTYQIPIEHDFPQWKELGGEYIPIPLGSGAIFKEDNSCLICYSRALDPEFERTAKEIARFSERDADTWVRVSKNLRPLWRAYLEWVYNPPPPPGEPDALHRLLLDPNSGFDPIWAVKSPLGILQDLFESDQVIAMLLRNVLSTRGVFPDQAAAGFEVPFLAISSYTGTHAGLRGGTHQWAHAATKIILQNGGKIFTAHEVDKVTIENGKAKGIHLTNGTEVEARRLVVSTLDPYNLCFQLIGKEHFNRQILRRVEKLERRTTTITWYTWAVHELPKYIAADFNSDVNNASYLMLISKDTEALIRERATLRLGKMPEDLQLSIGAHSMGDETRVPEGKSSILTEQFVLPADALSEGEWTEYKSYHAAQIMDLWQKLAPNMTWDNVIGYIPLTPYDHCKLANMAPTGNWAIIDHNPSQVGRFRPIPELANYRTPVENLYATGSAWHPLGGGILI